MAETGMHRVICPECHAQGERSTVTDHGGMITAMGWSPYYDEDGLYHRHDPNVMTTAYSCSRGHRWTTRRYRRCPNCDYGGEIKEGE